MSAKAGCQACSELLALRKEVELIKKRLAENESPAPAEVVFNAKMLCSGGLDAALQKIKMQNKMRAKK